MNKQILSAVILTAILSGVASFYAGYKSAPKSDLASIRNLAPEQKMQKLQELGLLGNGQMRNGANNQGRNNNRNTAAFANGEILNANDKNLTVKMRDGGSKIIVMASSTQVTKSAEGTLADLITGKQVMINGINNSDGSMTASYIQIRPEDMPFNGPGGPENQRTRNFQTDASPERP